MLAPWDRKAFYERGLLDRRVLSKLIGTAGVKLAGKRCFQVFLKPSIFPMPSNICDESDSIFASFSTPSYKQTPFHKASSSIHSVAYPNPVASQASLLQHPWNHSKSRHGRRALSDVRLSTGRNQPVGDSGQQLVG